MVSFFYRSTSCDFPVTKHPSVRVFCESNQTCPLLVSVLYIRVEDERYIPQKMSIFHKVGWSCSCASVYVLEGGVQGLP